MKKEIVMMKKKFLALTLAMALGLGLTACGSNGANSSASGSNNDASNPGTSSVDGSNTGLTKLVLGTSADYPPFEFHVLQDGEDKIVGIDVFLAEQIAEDMGAELEISDMDFDMLLNLMNKGDVDMVIAAMELKDDRAAAADYSDPYYTDEAPLIVVRKADLDQYKTLEDFTGKAVGAQTGTTKADIVLGTDPEKPHMTDVQDLLLPKVTDLIAQLQFEKCDAVVLDAAVAQKYVASNDELAIVESIDLGEAAEPYRVWVAKGDPKGLLPSINETIATVTAEGGAMTDFIEQANDLVSQAQ